MGRFYFDVWAAASISGTALGELTQAFDRKIRAADQAIGSGQFSINRHDSQYTSGWCAARNLVRVRLVTGGPFAYDDSRYVFAFFIEEGADVIVSSDEKGGEIITRGGRDPISILRRAVAYPEADFAGDENYTKNVPETGEWEFNNLGPGEVLRVFLRNAGARTPDPLSPMTHDFSVNTDSAGVTWPDTDTDWTFPVGTDYLSIMATLVSGRVYYRIGPDLDLHAYENHPGVDLSGSISFVKGVNIREAADRQMHASPIMGRAIVRGRKKNGKLQFREVINTAVEAVVGRIEGFVDYRTTSTASRLNRAGRQAIRKSKNQHDGPTSAGVLDTTGNEAFIDYLPGDTVLVNIPGEYNSQAVKVAAVALEETEGGEYDPILEFEESPFDPSTGEGNRIDGKPGPGDGGPAGCADCPPVATPPFDPPTPPGLCHLLPGSSSASGGGGSCTIPSGDNACDTQPPLITLYGGATYKAIIDVHHPGMSNYLTVNFATSVGGVGHDFGSMRVGNATTHYEETFEVAGTNFAGYHARLFHVGYVGYSGVGASVSIDVYYVSGADPRFDGIPCDESDEQEAPVSGQPVRERADDGDGTTAADATDYAFRAGSLEVWVAGVDWTLDVTESNPAVGTYVLAHPPPVGATVLRRYQGVGNIDSGTAQVIPTTASLTTTAFEPMINVSP